MRGAGCGVEQQRRAFAFGKREGLCEATVAAASWGSDGRASARKLVERARLGFSVDDRTAAASADPEIETVDLADVIEAAARRLTDYGGGMSKAA
jgi:hypothetical protein